MFTHFGVQLVSTLRGATIAQVRLMYNHHMATEVKAMAKDLNLGACKCYDIHGKKGTKKTEVILEFDSSPDNWLKYSALKTEISILQKELDIKRLRNVRASIGEDIRGALNPFVIND